MLQWDQLDITLQGHTFSTLDFPLTSSPEGEYPRSFLEKMSMVTSKTSLRKRELSVWEARTCLQPSVGCFVLLGLTQLQKFQQLCFMVCISCISQAIQLLWVNPELHNWTQYPGVWPTVSVEQLMHTFCRALRKDHCKNYNRCWHH